MTEHPDQYGAEVSQDDPAFGAAAEANPGEHRPDGDVAGTSDDTGTIYDVTGEPDVTPNDELPDEDDVDGPNAGTSARTEE